MAICAVMVLYHPDVQIGENILALSEQVDNIVIVDNGSDPSIQSLLENMYLKLHIIRNQSNLGIAAALNIGVIQAKRLGCEWVATFDQDSKVTPGMISQMLQVYEAYPNKGMLAGLSPCFQDQESGKVSSNNMLSQNAESPDYQELLVAMTSGHLLKTSIFNTVGYFNEDLFIDHVDTEFCLRCAAFGYKFLEVNDAILEHNLGTPTQHRLMWKTFTTTNHSALRRYYNARNGIFIYREYLWSQPRWVLKHMKSYVKSVIVMLLFEHDRLAKVTMIGRGIWDGLLGKFGKYAGQERFN